MDFTMATPRAAASLTCWEVSQAAVISDHSLITFQSLTKIWTKKIWDFKKADWNKFTKNVEARSKE